MEIQFRPSSRLLSFGLVPLGLGLGFGLGLSIYQTTELVEAMRWVDHTHEVIAEGRLLSANVGLVEALARGFALSGDEDFVGRYAQRSDELHERFAHLVSLAADRPWQQQLHGLKPLLDERLAALAETIQVAAGRSPDPARLRELTLRGDKLTLEIRDRLAAFQAEEEALLVQRLRDSSANAKRAAAALLGASVAGALLVFAILRGMRREIRSREAAELEARRKETLLRTIIDTVDDGIWMADSEGKVVFSNAAAVQIFGSSMVDDPGSMGALEVFQLPEFRPLADSERPSRRALRGEVLRNVAVLVKSPANPEGVFIETSATPVPDGLGVVSVLRDVSERRRAELLLQAHTERIEDLYDNAPCGYHSLDAAGVYVHVNQTELHWLGYRREDVLGRSFADFLTPASRAEFHRSFPGFLAQGHIEDLELELVRRDGPTLFVMLSATAVLGPDGQVALSRSVIVDMTERRRVEIALRGSRDALAVVNLELDTFCYSVSHDLRAPLRAIDGFSQALAEDCAERLDEVGRGHLEHIRAAARRMSQLIDDLLRLSQVTRAPLRREAVDVSSLALELVEGLREADPARTLQVVVQPGLAARGDRTLLRAALQNLLGNAWKFTRQQPEARIEVGGGVRDGLPVFWVRDNGAGFDMTFVGKLFAPFQRLHSRSEFEGTGIGLATVARIVRRHGGRVWAEGAPGAGASFYFTLRDDAADEKEVECATA